MMDDAVRIVTTAETPTAVVAETTTWDVFPALWPELLGEVWTVLRGSGLATGRNVMLYKDHVPNVEVGVEVDRSFAPAGRVVPSSLPAGRAATTVARGAPLRRGLREPTSTCGTGAPRTGIELTGVRWEIYGHWRDDQDPALFETEVYWQLA